MQTIGDRICEIRKFYFGESKGANKDFATKLGVSPNVVSNWCGRGDGIGGKVVSQILTAFPDVDKGWLVGGNGEMLAPQPPENEKIKIHIAPMQKAAETPNKSGFSLVDGFSEKLRLLGYEAPKDEQGYKMIALDLAERLNRATSMSEEMVGMVSKPLLDRLGYVEKQKAMLEARAAALEAKLAAKEAK